MLCDTVLAPSSLTMSHSTAKCGSVFGGGVLARGPGAGCCVADAAAAAPAPPLLAVIDASVLLVSGSGSAAAGLGPR